MKEDRYFLLDRHYCSGVSSHLRYTLFRFEDWPVGHLNLRAEGGDRDLAKYVSVENGEPVLNQPMDYQEWSLTEIDSEKFLKWRKILIDAEPRKIHSSRPLRGHH